MSSTQPWLEAAATVCRFRQEQPRAFASLVCPDDDYAAMMARVCAWAETVKTVETAQWRAFLTSCVGQRVSVFENTRSRQGVLVSVDFERDTVTIQMPERDTHICERCTGRYSHVDEDFDNHTQYTLVWFYDAAWTVYRQRCEAARISPVPLERGDLEPAAISSVV